MSRPLSDPGAAAARPRARRVAAALGLALALAAAPAAAGDDRLERLRALGHELRWAEVDSLAATLEAEARSRTPADSLTLARALAHRGLSRWGRRLYRDSLALRQLGESLEIGARLAGRDTLEWAGTEHALGRVLTEMNAPDSALVHLERARRLREARLGAADTLVADSWFVIAQARQRRRDHAAALAAIDRAWTIRRAAHAGDHSELGFIQAQRGHVLSELRRHDEARTAYEASLDIYGRWLGPDAYELQYALNGLATLEHRLGRTSRAVELLERAIAVTRLRFGEDTLRLSPMRGNLAMRLRDLGDHAWARREFEWVLAAYERTAGPGASATELARVQLALAEAALGDTGSAFARFTTTRRVLESQGIRPFATLQECYWRLADLWLARGVPDSALALAERALALDRAARTPSPEGQSSVLELIARIERARGHRPGLERVRDEMTALLADSAFRRTSRLPTAYATRARIASWLGESDAAWTDALAAEDAAYARLEPNLLALDERSALTFGDVLDRRLDLALACARGRGEADVSAAWERLVRWRGAAHAAIEARRPPAAAAGDTAWSGAHARWRDAQRRLAEQLVSGAAQSRDPVASARAEAARADAAAAERALMRAAAGRAFATAPATLAAALAARPADAALASLVEIDAGSDSARVLAFVAPPGGAPPRLLDLGASRAIAADVGRWIDALGRPPGARDAVSERECRVRGLAVRRALWDPLVAAAGAAAGMLIVPDGPASDLPWHALPIERGRYLAEAHAVRVLEAERDLLAAPHDPGIRGLLALGAPDFGAAPEPAERPAMPVAALVRAGLGACGERPRLDPLPGAAAEVEELGAAHGAGPARVLTGAAATERALREEAGGRSVLHLATHGIVLRDTCEGALAGTRGVGGVAPLAPRAKRRAPAASAPPRDAAPPSPWLGRRVWLALAGAARGLEGGAEADDDGLLTAEEVATLDLRGVDWVVLSACHSGLAERWARGGASGMRRAFHLAGARSVFASRWSVGDQATREWMRALYEARARGLAAPEARRAADRAVLAARRASGRSTHPFHWAAFTVTGE